MYVTDYINDLIRKISSTGAVSTLAGSGRGYQDGNGTNAKFNTPWDINIDTANNLYVTEASRIRKVTPSGTVTTLTGQSTRSFTNGNVFIAQFSDPKGICFDNNNNMYVADYGNNRIRKISTTGEVTTFAGDGLSPLDRVGNLLSSAFNSPSDIIFKNNKFYIVDRYNKKIKVIQ